jgi:nitrate reductase gamma subunit
MSYRVYKWRKLPSPPMTLFPAPPTEAANTVNTIQEALLFKSLFGGDRVLWLFAWVFHVLLALILVGHLRVFANVDTLLMKFGMSAENIQAMSGGVGGAAGVVILATAVCLLLRRLTIPRVREITGLGDCFALLLIGAILITGNMMRFGAEHFDLATARSYFAGLASFSDVAGAGVLNNNLFLVHMTLALLLVILMPFSKILHFGGIFFTHQLIRKH